MRIVFDTSVWAELIRDGIVVDVRRGDFDDPLDGVIRVGDPGEVDVVVGKWKWEQRVVDNAEPLQIAGILMPVAAPLPSKPPSGLEKRTDLWLRCSICGRPGRFVDPFPHIPRRR